MQTSMVWLVSLLYILAVSYPGDVAGAMDNDGEARTGNAENSQCSNPAFSIQVRWITSYCVFYSPGICGDSYFLNKNFFLIHL